MLPRSGSLTHFKHTGVGSGLVPSSPAALGFSAGPLWSLPMGWGWWDGSWEGMEKLAGQIHTSPCG